ncbi:sigma factor-like helix-turn-helix DNA-binding protein [Streptomyces stramineus]
MPEWPHALRRPSAGSYAWSLLKEQLHGWAADRRAAGPAPAPFSCVPRPASRGFREELAALGSRIGFYAAVARLPERQSDVLVLHCVIGYSPGQVAELLGVDEQTVRARIGLARRRLASASEDQRSVRGK